jgi:hypothetical protein
MTGGRADIDLLVVQGMREILDTYATNTFRRTDRAYIHGWRVACATYDHLLVHLAEQRDVPLPKPLLLVRAWCDEERRANKAVLADAGLSVRLPEVDGSRPRRQARWRRERLAAHVVAAGTLLANVAAGGVDEDVLTIFHRPGWYERPGMTTVQLAVDWHPTAYYLPKDVGRAEFMVTTAHRGAQQVTSGMLRPGGTGIPWDLVHGGYTHRLTRHIDRAFDPEW